jgi:hypothetical protein
MTAAIRAAFGLGTTVVFSSNPQKISKGPGPVNAPYFRLQEHGSACIRYTAKEPCNVGEEASECPNFMLLFWQ